MPRLPQKDLFRHLMMAPIAGAKTSGFHGVPVPLHKKIPVFHFKITGICSKIIPVLTQTQLFIF